MKKFRQITLIAVLLCLTLTFAACGGIEVKFDIGDATLVSGDTSQKYKEGSPITAPTLQKDGYVFDGWDKDFSNPTEPMTINPLWKKLHTVTFDVADAAVDNSALLHQEIVDGKAATAPYPTRQGYMFDGWDTEFSAVTSDLTVKAKWKKVHTVTFEIGDDATANDPALLTQQVADGGSATLPTVARDKYNFLSWDTDVSHVTGDVVVKANWERKTFTSSELFKLVNPATVEIKTYRANDVYFGMGSGFFINQTGLLLTNYHVIENASSYKVTTSDEEEFIVTTVVAYDIEKDIAILQVNTNGKQVAYLDITPELPESGDAVYAIGSSLGLTGTFSSGIVSYVNREIDGVKYIQTTAPISEGNSGGPLVNEQGYVVGINSASYTEGQNLNLAVEISQYKTLKDVNMTPDAVFKKEATLKYWFGEVIAKETHLSGTTGQIVSNGSTVQSTIKDANDDDFYMVYTPDEVGVLLIMIKTENKNDKDVLYCSPIYTEGLDIDSGYWLPENYYMISLEDDGDGTEYITIMIVVPEDLVKASRTIGIGLGADRQVNYEMFMYMVTAEEAEAFT